ncbi:transposase [Paenibacillus thalictri]|uniref:transposase n=1 Tax=Paenibacillus thalictri TaxID=2527873 RepID=UPI00197F5032|nr:transposase [Paenibacillus thalictri]
MHPHRFKGWMNAKPQDPAEFAEKTREISRHYRLVPLLHTLGVHVVSIDEMTGKQTLERLHPLLPMKPGWVERREFEYLRHGTLSLISGLAVAMGKIVSSTMAPTRNENDFAAYIEQLIDTDPQAEWAFIVDGLNTHQSESLVRLVAQHSALDDALGKKGKSGVLARLASPAIFLADPSHRIRFVYTPKHCSWLNMINYGSVFWFVVCSSVEILPAH